MLTIEPSQSTGDNHEAFDHRHFRRRCYCVVVLRGTCSEHTSAGTRDSRGKVLSNQFLGGPMTDRTPEQQAEYDRKVEQIATATPPKLTAGPFSYHRPVTVYQPKS